MPTYDYQCENGHRFEAFQSMKDEPLRECKECGAPAKRLIGPGAGFLFKGGGFYITDYRSKEYKEKAKSDGKPAEASAKGDAKTASGTTGESTSSSTSEAKSGGTAGNKGGEGGKSGGSKDSKG